MKLGRYQKPNKLYFPAKTKRFFIERKYIFYESLDPILKKGKFSESFALVSFTQAIEDVKYLQQDKIVHHIVKTSYNILNKKNLYFDNVFLFENT
jgi:hypothetical protein